jgi:hypothetical protein
MNLPRSPFVWSALWLATAALAFWAGRGSAPMISASPGGAVELAAGTSGGDGPAKRILRSRSGDEPETRINIRSSSGGASSAAEARPAAFRGGRVDADTVARLLSDTDPLRRMAGITDLLQGVTAENAKDLLAVFQNNRGRGPERDQEFGLFLEAWSRVDGPSAIEWVTTNSSPSSFGGFGGPGGGRGGRGGGGPGGEWQDRMNTFRVLSGWASTDPEAARTWAATKGEGQEENPYLIGVVNGLARTDVGAATELLSTMSYGRMRGIAADRVIESVMVNGADAGIGWARGIADEQLRDGVMARLADRISETDPARSLSLLGDIKDPERKTDTVRDVVSNWVRTDANAAATWVQNLDDPALKVEAQTSMVQSWARRDADAAAKWLDAQPKGPELDKPIMAYVERTSMRDPQKALLMANSISDEQTRRTTLEQIMGRWMEFDPEGANKFLNKTQ